MTLITPTIVPIGGDAWRLSWTGTADRAVRVFVNGGLVYGPVQWSSAAKAVDVGLPTPAMVEVHENPRGESVPANRGVLPRRPLIWWQTVPAAAQYRVYVDDVQRAVVLNQPSTPYHQVVLSADVRLDGGAWRELRVEAVSGDNVETISDPTYLFVPGLPLEEPASVEVAGSGGTFDIEVTP